MMNTPGRPGGVTWTRSAARQGRLESRLGLAGMANRIQVEYGQPGESSAGQAAWPATAWLEDPVSLEHYGVKELRLRLPGASRPQAEAYQAQALETHRLPAVQVQVISGPAPRANPAAALHCRGWWHRLDWRYYANPAGRAANLCGGRQDWLGAQTADSAYAQGFIIPGTEAWAAASLKLRVKKIGDPQDSLTARLCANSNGQPGSRVVLRQHPWCGRVQRYAFGRARPGSSSDAPAGGALLAGDRAQRGDQRL